MALIKSDVFGKDGEDCCLYYGFLCNINDIRRATEKQFKVLKAELAEKARQHLAECYDSLEPEEPGYVYAVESNNFIKIGISQNPNQRLKGLSTGNPLPVKMLKTWWCKNAARAEAHLHADFSRYRAQGEWFRLPPAAKRLLLARESL